VFSYIPNTAETSFSGLVDGINQHLADTAREQLIKEKDTLTTERINELLSYRPRIEKIATKDVKLRTFITAKQQRGDMVHLVYDTTYGLVREGIDNLVVIDDSIVRGTTLKQSIIGILDRLGPKKIVIVSSAPQIRYPDCYGIDMSRFGEFIAWKALVALIEEHGMQQQLTDCYDRCKAQLTANNPTIENEVKKLYALFSYEAIEHKIGQLVTPEGCKAEVQICYQTIEGLHAACPDHRGDWYFSGDYPTRGGAMVVNRAYMYWYDKITDRPY
jgi:amidophosphoribosyltransferase